MYICHHCACTTITVISGCARVAGGLEDPDDDIAILVPHHDGQTIEDESSTRHLKRVMVDR